MKRLAVYDFDGTLMNSPEKEAGMQQWEKVKGEPYPYQGWWGRKESLDTSVFDIKPIPDVYNKFMSDINAPNTHVIILTARQEKLRPEVENILNLNDIHADELVMKKGRDDKGDIILKYVNNNPDLEYIVVYDDFAGGVEDKMKEFTKISDELKNRGIDYHVRKVVDGRVGAMLESTNILSFMINDEVLKFREDTKE